jgi:hypothetical protein
MKRTLLIIVLIWVGLAALTLLARATTIQLELYNSYPLLDSDALTPLAGNSAAGDLVQVIAAGADNTINGPSPTGGVGGDDTVLFTLHVGVGIPSSGTGLLDVFPLDYSSSLIDSNFYVRFWNAATIGGSTYYGNSSVYQLPAGDAFNLASLDFVPLSTSPRTADQPFGASVIPEPSDLFLFGLFVMGAVTTWRWTKRKRHGVVGAAGAAVVLGVAVRTASAQIIYPQEVWSSAPIVDASGAMLPGTNPRNASNSCATVSGCVVQILVANGGVAHLPNLDGTPSGGDSNVFQTTVGVGTDICSPEQGQFDGTFQPAPPNGTKLYARVFNAPSVGQATEWNQSATFTVDGITAMDLAALGLRITTMPEGVNLSTIDPKGETYYYELVANTNPQNPNDVFQAGNIVAPNGGQTVQVGVKGHSGRAYTLQRTTGDLASNPTWTPISTSGMLAVDTSLLLTDPSPPNSSKAFYRIDVTMP